MIFWFVVFQSSVPTLEPSLTGTCWDQVARLHSYRGNGKLFIGSPKLLYFRIRGTSVCLSDAHFWQLTYPAVLGNYTPASNVYGPLWGWVIHFMIFINWARNVLLQIENVSVPTKQKTDIDYNQTEQSINSQT